MGFVIGRRPLCIRLYYSMRLYYSNENSDGFRIDSVTIRSLE